MIEDVYEPLKKYRDSFREKFSELTAQKFRELLEKSGIDFEANRKLVAEIRDLKNKSSDKSQKSTMLAFACVLLIIVAVACGFIAYSYSLEPEKIACLVAACVASCILAFFAAKKCVELGKQISALKSLISKKTDEAREQMRPLNELYTWDIPIALIEKTVPRLDFDPYLTTQRLDDLKRIFGWDDSFTDGKSILFSQSGVINGNPFVFGEYLRMVWSTKTYTGYKTISWRESVTDGNGRRRTVTRTQTLSASVNKPYPKFSRDRLLIYGNDAAPNLNFSRSPTGLSNAEEGFVTSIRKWFALRDLKEYSEELDDDSDFTLMSNHEFETLFHAKNRDNEVEFRLLFTSLAQEQMLELLKDDEIGYGDDFTFIKRGKINLLHSKHLSASSLSTDPEIFHDWDFDRAHLNFKNFNENYFKNLYFSLAPLLAIPLYQQTRTYKDIYKGEIQSPPSSWEHEAIANYYGAVYFKHESSITENILKTQLVERKDGVSKVRVTANGFGGKNRVDYESVWGGDGRFHRVPIRWVEYFPVERESYMYVSENSPVPESLAHSDQKLRRNIYACI